MVTAKGFGGESSSDHVGRAALIPAKDSSATYGRHVKLTYKIEKESYVLHMTYY